MSLLTEIRYGSNNIKAEYGSKPQAWKVDVDPAFIAATKLKANLTRFVEDTIDDLPPIVVQRYGAEGDLVLKNFEDGPPRYNATTLRDFWADEYDWVSVQDKLNAKYNHFTTTVHAVNFTDPIPLHFIHHRSNRSDAIPLLFLHGWPGSFMEVGKLLDGLLNPPNYSMPAFHVVAPSIPGFSFSPAPRKAGLAPRAVGQGYNDLMQQLGYERYVIQGGDFGGMILRHMAPDFPANVVSVLSNFWLVPPNTTDIDRYTRGLTTAAENFTIEALTNFTNLEGYRQVQQTRPLALAAAMGDSPIGFTLWIYDFMFRHADEYPWTPEEIITWSMMYYIQGPYSGFRMYKEIAEEGDWDITRYTSQPVGISTFPNDGFFTSKGVNRILYKNLKTSPNGTSRMPLGDIFHAAREYARDSQNAYSANTDKLVSRLSDVVLRTWDLGFTAFGGPPVHFQIEHRRFVEGRGGKAPWIDEQIYQELFAICQALPGPGSTKMLFCIVMIHAGLLPAIVAFSIWSLPGAIAMYALSLGVQRINEVLPSIAYAFLSGLNASTVGIVALAAVQLAEKAIKDNVTRILVIGGACAGLCYTALWYFPALIFIGGVVTVIWDMWLRQQVSLAKRRWQNRRQRHQISQQMQPGDETATSPIELSTGTHGGSDRPRDGLQRRNLTQSTQTAHGQVDHPAPQGVDLPLQGPETDTKSHAIPVLTGICIIIGFFASFIAILVTRGLLNNPPRPLDLFANMYLAGTIIFGGGPVVIPLLTEYVVQPGWVSPRDFLIGLAIIQAFPGPNFNFAVYLGALSLLGTSNHTILGALLGYIGIFVPGIILAIGFQSLWRVLRKKTIVNSLLRGVNATAVGLVFTAVYRLWQIGYLTPESSRGTSLAEEPWWVVVAVLTYAESAWFHVPAPAAIVAGGVLGFCWYGVTS
ncbi:hypothetical protein LTR84_003528 [Exophiala bonariae]|uniref:Epoxide hydrolase N-terminal domain-containing protein n=1 Tax=Exophiala bonariae TaxID=1690606 RepID=A0AAV9N9G6_9EURO|nr:hypothetical protein LTR84_003528 [Exophiala bonariae]